MFLQTSISHLFILLLYFPLSSNAYNRYEYNITDCDYGNGTYKKDSPYHDNLKLLLDSLSNSTPITGYFQDKKHSSNDSNDVFGHALCRGDVQLLEDCSPCLINAVSQIGKFCPNKKNAAVLYKNCFLRYSNQNFFGIPTGTERFINFTAGISKNNREKFIKVREKLFEKLLREATNGTKSPSLFDLGKEVVTSDLTVYGLVQCTRDLSKEDCHDCLKIEIQRFPDTGGYSVALVTLGKSCFLRYDNQIFYEESNPQPSPETSKDVKGKMIGIIVGVGLCIAAMVFLLWFSRMKKKRKRMKIWEKMDYVETPHIKSGELQNDGIKIAGIEHLSLKYADLQRATNFFSRENVIGQGGSGFVYKGILNEQQIAVKRLSDKDSLRAAEQLDKEVTLLAGLQHVNLVRLIGYCIQENEMLLVYEYMANGSLETHLFDTNSSRKVLNWTSRLNIIDGIIKGIQYLHEDSQPKIFHRDLKPENILLDENSTPKITDFGISKSSDVNQTRGNITTNIIGTGGYMAPEYRFYGQFSSNSDIYSLGVMLLEILTGIRWSRNNNMPHIRNLKDHIFYCWRDAALSEKLAKIECDAYTEAQEKILANILHIATLCIENDPDLRPKISKVYDLIKLSSNSSFKIGHRSTEGEIDDSNPLFSFNMETTEATRSMLTIEITREMNNDTLR